MDGGLAKAKRAIDNLISGFPKKFNIKI